LSPRATRCGYAAPLCPGLRCYGPFGANGRCFIPSRRVRRVAVLERSDPAGVESCSLGRQPQDFRVRQPNPSPEGAASRRTTPTGQQNLVSRSGVGNKLSCNVRQQASSQLFTLTQIGREPGRFRFRASAICNTASCHVLRRDAQPRSRKERKAYSRERGSPTKTSTRETRLDRKSS